MSSLHEFKSKVMCMSMAVDGIMACQFSEDGKYFAQLGAEGKFKIWNTLTNIFEQEFTPDFQLTGLCTCLQFVSSSAATKLGIPRKKKRRESAVELDTRLVLGSTSGHLLIYSLTKGDLNYTIDSSSSQCINCLSASKDELVYSGTDSNILVWNLHKRNIVSKWSTNNEKVSAIFVIASEDRLLTASKLIKLWSISSQEVLKIFTGHSSLVSLLHYISPRKNGDDSYVISGSKGDRLLSCWNLNEQVESKIPVASFLMEDIVNHISVDSVADGSTHIAATVRSGVVHVYRHVFNGKKSNKPIKPKTTIQVVSDSQEKEIISPIYISGAIYRSTETLCICYGNSIVQTFEDIEISSYKKLHCLLRADLQKKTASKDNQVSKVRAPIVGNDVHYLSSQTSTVPTKRKNDGQQEVPMEKRLENLMMNDSDSVKVPKGNNVAQLLIQGLHSKDKNIIKTVLCKKDEQLIKNTIKRIPVTLIPTLFEELSKLIQGKTLAKELSLMWLRNLILIHAGLLLSNPTLPEMFGEVLGSIEAGIALQASRNKLVGRLELLVSQISNVSPQETENNEPILIFNDKVSDDSDNEEMEFEEHSSSDNEWDERSSEDENIKMNDSDNEIEIESDDAMST